MKALAIFLQCRDIHKGGIRLPNDEAPFPGVIEEKEMGKSQPASLDFKGSVKNLN